MIYERFTRDSVRSCCDGVRGFPEIVCNLAGIVCNLAGIGAGVIPCGVPFFQYSVILCDLL